mgnify:CR=1 FL=1
MIRKILTTYATVLEEIIMICTAVKILEGFSSVTRVRPTRKAKASKHSATGTMSPTACLMVQHHENVN